MQNALKTKSSMAISAALLAGLLIAASSSSHAFTSQSVVTKSASATLTGAGVVTMTVVAKNMSDNATVTDIAWTGVTLPTGWKNADQYLELASNITAATGGIRIITDNKDATANPQYTGPNNTAGGLVDNTNPANALQLEWTIKDTIVGSTGPVSAKPYEAAVDGAGSPAQFQWLFMTDEADTTLAPGAPYRTAVRVNGIHFGGGDTEFGAAASPNYIYLGANFATAVTPRTYSTNKLIVEAYTE